MTSAKLRNARKRNWALFRMKGLLENFRIFCYHYNVTFDTKVYESLLRKQIDKKYGYEKEEK